MSAIRAHAAAATPRIASRTQRVSSRASRRNSRRDWDIGPWLVTTVRSSSQSGSPYSHCAGRLVEAQVGVRDDQPELADAWHVDGQELLAQLLGRLGLDPPVQVAVLLARGAWAVHLHERAPPALERVLDRRALRPPTR